MAKKAWEKALLLYKGAGTSPDNADLVVLTNAGYAEPTGISTEGALAALRESMCTYGVRSDPLVIHSLFSDSLWFAFYDKGSGLCAYLQVNETALSDKPLEDANPFSITSIENIKASYLLSDSPKTGVNEGSLGANAFRIISIANAAASGASYQVLRVLEFHDHFCPGVASGLAIGAYVKKKMPSKAYFVQALEPWCKEDALIMLLNATPGKKRYLYSPIKDKTHVLPEAKDASTVIYFKEPEKGTWKASVIAFNWADTGCRKGSQGIAAPLCEALWYLVRMDQSERLVKEIKTFEVPDGKTPWDWIASGVHPLEYLGLVK